MNLTSLILLLLTAMGVGAAMAVQLTSPQLNQVAADCAELGLMSIDNISYSCEPVAVQINGKPVMFNKIEQTR